MVFITAGYIQVSYPDERSKGSFIAAQNNLQAFGSIVCSIVSCTFLDLACLLTLASCP